MFKNYFKLIILLLGWFIANPAYADYVINYPVEIIQPDGTKIKCYITGDEYYNRLHDSLNYTIVRDFTSGYFYYAKSSGDELIPSEYIVGQIDPRTTTLVPGIDLDIEIIRERRLEQIMELKKSTIVKSPSRVKGIQVITAKGTLGNLVVFVRFADQEEFTEELSGYEELFNSNNNHSLKSYYSYSSYNTLEINSYFNPNSGNIITSYKDINPRDYYEPYSSLNPIGFITMNDRTEREHNLLIRALNFVKDDIPFDIELDGNNDKLIDNVSFVIQGPRSMWNQLLWPHAWALNTANIEINGLRVYNYLFLLGESINISTICHEFYHILGAPDLYHYIPSNITSVGPWDIMGQNMYPPQSMGAFMKYRYGNWIEDLSLISKSGTYSLNPLSEPQGNCFRINSPSSSTEFFILEHRKNNAEDHFESTLPGSGLLIYRINISKDGLGNESGPPDEVYVYRPQGSLTNNGNIENAFYHNDFDRTQINDATDPASFLSDGTKGSLLINNIREVNNKMVFDVIIHGIQESLNYPLFINEWNEFEIKIVAPEGNNYFVSIWDENGKTKPDWDWIQDQEPTSIDIRSSAVDLNLSESYTYSFLVYPTNEENSIQIELNKRERAGTYQVYQNINIPLIAIDRNQEFIPPTLVTAEIIPLTLNTFQSGGNIIKNGGSQITARGICWSTNPSPTTDLVTHTSDGTGVGEFTSTITGLLPGFTYYIRAYATNASGTGYGNEIIYETPDPSEIVADYDGNYYNIITIGSQVWMSEDLMVTHLSDGTGIPNVSDNTEWCNLSSPGYCWYNNESSTYKYNYGALYNWHTINTDKLCPAGWHVPDESEWKELVDNLGGSLVAGGKLKESTTKYWRSPNSGATNESGFKALPGGFLSASPGVGFGWLGSYGFWWTATESNVKSALYASMDYNFSDVSIFPADKTYGFSVRCIKDDNLPTLTTLGIRSITANSAISGGNITSDWGSTIITRGVCWNETGNPTVDLITKTSDGSGTGSFTSYITGLTPGTNYFVRAYATTLEGTSYGEVSLFKTSEHFMPVVWQGDGITPMTFYILTANLDGIDLQPDDEIGIFDEDICVAVIVLSDVLTGSNAYELLISQDNPNTPEKDGYTPGKPVIYKFWDSSEGFEIENVEAEYTSGEGTFTPNLTVSLHLIGNNPISQTINLSEGWNILSFAVEPENRSMSVIFDTTINSGTLIKIQDEKGNAVEKLPPPIGWINNIGLMSVAQGYKIKVSESMSPGFHGLPITSDVERLLEAGWNIIGYPYINPQPAMHAFEALINSGSLIKVQDEQGNAIEKLPDPIGWIDNIQFLSPGKGYKLKTNLATYLTINKESRKESQNKISYIFQNKHFKPIYKGNGLDHMNIYLTTPTIDGRSLKIGDEIGVFDGNLCVGAGVIENSDQEYLSLLVSFNDPSSPEEDGFTEGNAIHFQLWERETGLITETYNSKAFNGYNKIFGRSGTSVLRVNFESKSYSFLGDAFPNPSTHLTNFSFHIQGESKVYLEVFNSLGVIIKVLVAQDMPSGLHEIEWDNRTNDGYKLKSGFYYYRLRINDFSQTKQLIIK